MDICVANVELVLTSERMAHIDGTPIDHHIAYKPSLGATGTSYP